jgi:hypothetical protein
MKTRTSQNTAKKPQKLLRRKNLLQNTRPNRSNAPPKTQKTRNHNALHQRHNRRRRRRIHMQNRQNSKRSHTTDRKRLPIHHRNRRNKTIQKTKIKQPLSFFIVHQALDNAIRLAALRASLCCSLAPNQA